MKQGDRVKIRLVNSGGVDHELVVLNREDMVAHIKTWKPGENRHADPVFKDLEIIRIKPGESMSTTFTAYKPGSFVYACFVENPDLHAKLGMWAPFIVEG